MRNILVLDPGSSSLKFVLFRAGDLPLDIDTANTQPELERAISGAVERIGAPGTQLFIETAQAHRSITPLNPMSLEETLKRIVEVAIGSIRSTDIGNTLQPAGILMPADQAIDAIACRVVHGGEQFTGATEVTAEVVEAIRALSPLAPLHNPVAADLIEICLRLAPVRPISAHFDTTFHRNIPQVAQTYALPGNVCEAHRIHRYGFHGLAHQYVADSLKAAIAVQSNINVPLHSRLVTCHLGNGASVCAIRDGISIDTSMGMTPMEGLVMGTRSGDVDPGLLLYLLRHGGYTPEGLDHLLNRSSGLLGVSGISNDLRDLERAADTGDCRAQLAMDLFAYRVAKTVGSYFVALGGMDGLAFSGGIGEHSARMRSGIAAWLACLGVQLDRDRNNAANGSNIERISVDHCACQVWVIPADESLQMAQECFALLFAS